MPNSSFTPEQISQILEEFFKAVGTRQYIGARYVPIFGRKGEQSIQWDNSKPYEPLTIVLYQGDSYTSRQYVPEGVEITNELFWALTGNYNAQIEAYRREVQGFSDRIDAVEESNLAQADQLAGTTTSGLKELITTNTEHLADVDEQLAGTTDSGLRGLIGQNAADIQGNTDAISTLDSLMPASAFTSTNTVKKYIDDAVATVASELAGEMVVIGDSFTTDYYVDESDLWYHVVATALHVTPHAWAERGAGFAHAGGDGHNFIQLLNQSAQDNSFDHASVKYVFVYGGLNDLTTSQAANAFSTNLITFCTTARNYYPNALIVVCGINTWQDGYTVTSANSYRGQLYYERAMCHQIDALGAGITFIAMSGALGFNASYYDSSDNHPNANGQTMIAGWMLSYLFGSGMSHKITGNLLLSDNTNAGTIGLFIRAGVIGVSISSNTGSAGQALKDSLNFLRDENVICTGVALTWQTAGEADFGYLGQKNSEGLVNQTNHGYGRFAYIV